MCPQSAIGGTSDPVCRTRLEGTPARKREAAVVPIAVVAILVPIATVPIPVTIAIVTIPIPVPVPIVTVPIPVPIAMVPVVPVPVVRVGDDLNRGRARRGSGEGGRCDQCGGGECHCRGDG